MAGLVGGVGDGVPVPPNPEFTGGVGVTGDDVGGCDDELRGEETAGDCDVGFAGWGTTADWGSTGAVVVCAAAGETGDDD